MSCAACHAAETGAPSGDALDATLVRALAPEAATEEVHAPELPAEGGRIGRFVVVEAVGQGGMGIVFKAYDPALDRRVAVKLLRPGRGGSRDSGGTARLAREAQAMARLAHPNVVPVYDVGRFGESLFVAMEYVAGATLARWLTEKPRTWREVVAVCLQAGRGLEAAHAAGVIHRDFKPGNVLVGEDGRARVTDFGLARSSREDAVPLEAAAAPPISLDTPITVAGAVMGTPGYMAPEQYVGRATTAATDQYAFCVVLYEGLYGRRPFEGTDLPTLTALTQAGEVPPPPKGSPVPPWVHEIVAQGLAPDPFKRHASMTALLARLERDPSERRRRFLGAGAAACLTLGAAGGLWAWPTVRASSCHRDTDQLAAAWGPDVKARAERAFLQSGQPFAATAWDFARSSLDTFVTAWARERHLACDETLKRKERTEHQLALRLACLDRRRVELSTLATRFEAANDAVVAQSATAVTRLTPVARCANLDALELRAKLPDEARGRVDDIEQALAEGRVLVALGHYDDARRLITGATASARALGDQQTLAAAVFELGRLARDEDQYAAARAPLDEALRLAVAARDDRTALHALGLLASLVGWRLGEPKEALALVNIGRGLVPRVDDPALEALLDEGEGDARWRMNDNPGALAAYERALPLLLKVQGPNGLDVARMHSSIGWILMEGGQLSKAREAYERSRRAREALLGVDHPTLGTTWNELGHLAEQLDDRDAAVFAFRRSVELRTATKGADAPISARATVNYARALTAAGRLAEAEEALRVGAPQLDLTDPANVAGLGRLRAQLLLAKGDARGAEQAARSALTSNFDDETAQAEAGMWLGKARVAQHDDAGAREAFTRAAATFERFGPGTSTYAEVLVDLGQLAMRRGEAAEARAACDKARAAAIALEGNVRLKAEASLLAARARWAAGAKAEARAAADEAASFASAPGLAGLRGDAEAFLAAHSAD